ncbi:hypothetical protein V6Z11_D02G196200 [Gossypium hirsutum]
MERTHTLKSIPGKCYLCNLRGHRSNDCPRRKDIKIIECGDYEDELEEGNEIIWKLDGADLGDGQILAIGKIMLTLRMEI